MRETHTLSITKTESDLLLNLGCLTNSGAEVVELRTANLRLAEYYDLLNVGGMKGEGLLYTYTVGNTSNGKGLGDSAAMLSNNGTLEHLSSGLLTLGDTNVNLYTVTDAEYGNFGLKLLINKSLDLIHFMALLIQRTFMQSFAEDCSESHCANTRRHRHSCSNYITGLGENQVLFFFFLFFVKIYQLPRKYGNKNVKFSIVF